MPNGMPPKRPHGGRGGSFSSNSGGNLKKPAGSHGGRGGSFSSPTGKNSSSKPFEPQRSSPPPSRSQHFPPPPSGHHNLPPSPPPRSGYSRHHSPPPPRHHHSPPLPPPPPRKNHFPPPGTSHYNKHYYNKPHNGIGKAGCIVWIIIMILCIVLVFNADRIINLFLGNRENSFAEAASYTYAASEYNYFAK